MPPKFGTSGLRGLVTDLTPDLVAAHVRAFVAACATGDTIHVGRDLRPSSPAIAAAVIAAVRGAGLTAVDAGALPTPALALSAMAAGHAAIMVTGSHIPADRNGLKFHVPAGEITKADEAAILAALAAPAATAATTGALTVDEAAGRAWVDRIVAGFGAGALAGLRIGVWEHSSVARDLIHDTLRGLGAQTVGLGRSDSFIPVDTEAVDPDTRAQIAAWTAGHALDALVSTDGDADRPLVADAGGRIVPGDVLGPLTARMLGADRIATPVSSNGLVEAMGNFAVTRTKIGSPFVIAAMEAARAADPAARVAGYEANGGFLLGFAAPGPGRPAVPIMPLMTRDCLLPIVAPLAAARAAGLPLAALVAALPARFTAADRIAGIAPETAAAFLGRLTADPAARAAFFAELGPETGIDLTDGLRLGFADGVTLHLRPSGNAPEFRCYAEAGSPDRAAALVATWLGRVAARLG
jgi:phosphomannomutase